MPASVLTDSRISLAIPLLASKATAKETAAPSPTPEPRWARVLQSLAQLRQLQPDWDGQGSLPVSTPILDAASAWVIEMSGWQDALAPTRALPGTTGEIVLEWCTESLHLAAEISRPDRIEWLLNVPGQPIKQWESDLRGPWI